MLSLSALAASTRARKMSGSSEVPLRVSSICAVIRTSIIISEVDCIGRAGAVAMKSVVTFLRASGQSGATRGMTLVTAIFQPPPVLIRTRSDHPELISPSWVTWYG